MIELKETALQCQKLEFERKQRLSLSRSEASNERWQQTQRNLQDKIEWKRKSESEKLNSVLRKLSDEY